MKIYDNKDLVNLINYDLLSKFNLKNINEFYNFDKVNFIVKLKSIDSNFLKLFFDLSKLICYFFNKKFYIFNVLKENFKSGKFKNSLIFNLGVTLRKKDIFLSLDYLKNILYNLSKKIDNNLYFKNFKNCYSFKFSNLNYFIGLNNENFYRSNFNFNINLLFCKKKNTLKIKKFYEKLFF